MKITKKILALSCVALLASCGGAPEISKEDAAKNLDNAAKKVAAGEVKVPGAVTMTMLMESQGESSKAVVSLNTEAKYLHIKEDILKQEVWVYAEGDKLVYVNAGETGGSYYYGDVTDFEVSTEDYGYDFESVATEYYDMFKQLMATDYAAQAQAQVSLSVEGITIKKNEISQKFTSTGEGNLGVNIKVDVLTETTAVGVKSETGIYFVLDAVIDNYLPSSLNAEIKMTGGVLSGAAQGSGNMNMKIAETFEWGKCDMGKPDLSKYSSETFEGEAE